MITIKDVAKEAKVSISTVSNVINGVDVVKDATKEHVMSVIKKLNYTPNLSGKFLKGSKTMVLGIFLTNIEGAFFSVFLNAMHFEAAKHSFGLTIFLDNEKVEGDSARSILANNIDGAIVLNEKILDEHLDYLKNSNIPIIFLDREVDDDNLKSVVIDNHSAIKDATKYLTELGHKKIGFLHGNVKNYDEEQRYLGFLSALKELGLEHNQNFEINGGYHESIAYDAIKEHIAKKLELPEAFICANDLMAFGAIRALESEGYSVPNDISVIGFDNIEKTEYFSPKITTVDPNPESLGINAIQKLIKIINKENVVSEKISANLVIRDSCTTKF